MAAIEKVITDAAEALALGMLKKAAGKFYTVVFDRRYVFKWIHILFVVIYLFVIMLLLWSCKLEVANSFEAPDTLLNDEHRCCWGAKLTFGLWLFRVEIADFAIQRGLLEGRNCGAEGKSNFILLYWLIGNLCSENFPTNGQFSLATLAGFGSLLMVVGALFWALVDLVCSIMQFVVKIRYVKEKIRMWPFVIPLVMDALVVVHIFLAWVVYVLIFERTLILISPHPDINYWTINFFAMVLLSLPSVILPALMICDGIFASTIIPYDKIPGLSYLKKDKDNEAAPMQDDDDSFFPA